jgi:transcription termination factor Rho
MIDLLIDERPEEVTDMARHVNAEVISSTLTYRPNAMYVLPVWFWKKQNGWFNLVTMSHPVDSITRLARVTTR